MQDGINLVACMLIDYIITIYQNYAIDYTDETNKVGRSGLSRFR